MASYFEILCGITALLLAVYYYATLHYDFWKSRGVVGPRPIPFLGTSKDIIFVKTSMAEYTKDIYLKYKHEPMIGLYNGRLPFLLLNDLELIKDVLIRDFSKFSDRGLDIPERAEPLSSHLFNLETARWRPLRAKLSPVFTSGKLKEMFHLIMECSHHLEEYLNEQVVKDVPIECRELTAKFTTDVIGSCAFGIEMNALSNEDSEFRRMGRKLFTANLENTLRLKMRLFFSKIYNLFGYLIRDRTYAPFFTRVVTDTMKYRTDNNIYRPDFINMLMELRKHPDKVGDVELTDTLLTAQAFVFFAAGFETSSTTMSNALYELAQHQDLQNKLREEIREYDAKRNGNLKYEDIKDMAYLDKVFKETLRIYSPASILIRKSMCNYTFNGTKITIPKGTAVWIPVYAIHHDPDIYPNPETFDPERFSEEAIAARHPMSHIPFGDGPRNCIGARFAVYQSKIGLITIIRNYKVDVCEKTIIPYKLDPAAALVAPKGGIHLRISKI